MRVRTGAEMLVADGYRLLAGKRIGLIVNHTATVRGTHLADLVQRAPGLSLTALFVPEHGLRGASEAGEKVGNDLDARTGLPVFSLYGTTRKPTKAMLQKVDVLVFDMQDVGARFYTYISTMGLAMQAAAEAGISFVVLDRPNPLGGTYLAGFNTQPAQISFVGQYPIPAVHGMTVGELARLIKGEKLLPGLENLALEVIPMHGWQRSMRWSDTALAWIKPSPNIIDFETALVYAGTALFEATTDASHGRGTKEPFRLVGAHWADGENLARTLNARRLPGVRFEAARFTPRAIPGMATEPALEGRALQGVRIIVTDTKAFLPIETGVHVIVVLNDHARARGQPKLVTNFDWLDKLAGTPQLRRMLREGASPDAIISAWQPDIAAFDRKRRKYLLY
jgi:uncharacterized protein YbbC (DUF1343 family)